MDQAVKELEKFKRSLDKKPKIPGINGVFHFRFVDKWTGKRDAQGNQICEQQEGHLTPHIDDKARMFDSYIDRMYLKTSLIMKPMVVRANSLVAEFNLLNAKKNRMSLTNGESAQRLAAMDAANAAKNEARKREILTTIAEMKAESDMIDESLRHHLERAEAIFHSCISRYWKGVLSASGEKLEHFPFLEQRESEGRKAYFANRKKLVDMIDEALLRGGATYVE